MVIIHCILYNVSSPKFVIFRHFTPVPKATVLGVHNFTTYQESSRKNTDNIMNMPSPKQSSERRLIPIPTPLRVSDRFT